MYDKIEKLIQGGVVKCKMIELGNIIRNINSMGINTLGIQQDSDKNIFWIKIIEPEFTKNLERRNENEI